VPQGKKVASKSEESIIKEAKRITQLKDFNNKVF
jgi:hypothetical protein